MTSGDTPAPRRWRRGMGALDWTSDERAYGLLLDALARDLAEAEAVDQQLDAHARRSSASLQADLDRVQQEERAAAQRELGAFRAALEDARARGGQAGVEVPYDATIPEQDAFADVLIHYLVRPGYASVRTEEPRPGRYVYWIQVDWPRIASLAEELGAPLAL